MGVRITMGGQDITLWVDELGLDIESNLGQGPGVPQGASGRATTCKFDATWVPKVVPTVLVSLCRSATT